ncbi:ATP-binding protein [Halobacillus andaensis]|uniref:ATP-binding protein n=1 Tax=Halobacillus andaensis TaxID=1176239 RepID=A0A917B6I1_HALAA|nr:ATP-binding protein [Halobacillus andaensis]MBP2006019.1 hypothetical protein [Halobacillus andaensis]GGF24250.1 ATP-binding protein [Halobacillus andaensis]
MNTMNDLMEQFQELTEKKSTEQNEKKTQSQLLLEMASHIELFHTPDDEAYALIPVHGHKEVRKVRSRNFKRWLQHKYYDKFKKAAGSQAVEDTLSALEGKALFEGEEHDVHLRVAEYEDSIYIDLCNKDWQAIQVHSGGWNIIDQPPVYFKRTNNMRPLPIPQKGGRVDDLKPFLNYKDDTQWKMITAWLLASIRPNSPYPILTVQGEQGSAKSTTTKALRALIDPSEMPLRTLPKDEKELSLAANSTWVLAFDNLSGVSNVLSDGLCKISTGGGLATRKLYTDDEEATFNVMRPTILNGIDDIAKRQDLLDRSIVLFLPSIPEDERSDEKTFWASFEQVKPQIMGALLDAISGALSEISNTYLDSKPRLADFALWATAAERTLGWYKGEFMDVYNRNRSDAIEQGLESNPLAVAVLEFMEYRSVWEATSSETLANLSNYAGDERVKKSKAWPSVNKLKEWLRRIAPGLKTKGIIITELPRTKKHRGLIRIENLINTDEDDSSKNRGDIVNNPTVINEPSHRRDSDGGDTFNSHKGSLSKNAYKDVEI